MRRIVLCASVLLPLLAGVVTTVHGEHDRYQQKWPWTPFSAVSINTLPFDMEHGCPRRPGFQCAAAYDVYISNNAVVSGAEGGVTLVDDTYTSCDAAGGYGIHVIAGGAIYAHLASVAAGVGEFVSLLQGDSIGTQGNTGNTLPPACGVHLHWEFTSGVVPAYINGTSTLAVGYSPTPVPPSTNSAIGEFSAHGATLRQSYRDHGAWATVGWTHNLGSGLYMAPYYGWGRLQDFRHHPDFFTREYSTFTVAHWDTSHAYVVDSLFWPVWAGGAVANSGALYPISVAFQDRGGCFPTWNPQCASYQRFHLGYVWMLNTFVVAAVYCPDVRPPINYVVNLSDVSWVLSQVGPGDIRADVNANAAVTLADVSVVLNEVPGVCYPV